MSNLIIVVFCSIISATAASLACYYISVSREVIFSRSDKAEQVYRISERLDQELQRFFEASYSLLSGKTTGDRACLSEVQRFMTELKMLVGFYFPPIAPALSRISVAINTTLKLMQELDSADQADRERIIEAVDLAAYELRQAVQDLKSRIIAEGNRLNSASFLALARHRTIVSGASLVRI